jgi:hypothetical protein
MIRILHLTSLLYLMAIGIAYPSSEGIVPITEMNLKSTKNAVDAAFKLDEAGRLDMVVSISGKVIKVPKIELEGFEGVDLHSIRIQTPVPSGVGVPDGDVKGMLIVSMKIGGAYVLHVDERLVIPVYSYAKLYFGDGKYLKWEMAVPKDDFKNEWHLYIKRRGEVKKSNGIVESAECPIDTVNRVR